MLLGPVLFQSCLELNSHTTPTALHTFVNKEHIFTTSCLWCVCGSVVPEHKLKHLTETSLQQQVVTHELEESLHITNTVPHLSLTPAEMSSISYQTKLAYYALALKGATDCQVL